MEDYQIIKQKLHSYKKRHKDNVSIWQHIKRLSLITEMDEKRILQAVKDSDTFYMKDDNTITTKELYEKHTNYIVKVIDSYRCKFL